MHIITRRRLLEFIDSHPNAEAGLEHWYRIMKSTDFDSLVDMRQAFPHVDRVGRLTVFNIGGNNYRLIVAIHYNRNKVYIRNILTHSEYDKDDWKK